MISQYVGEALLGWLIADLFSGLFHFWQDRWGAEDTPFIGGWLIRPARLHHEKPLVFLDGSFLYRNGATFAFVGLIAGFWLMLFGPSVMLAAAVLGGALTTQVHYWAHRPGSAGPTVRMFQEIGLIQSPKHHAGHHRPPQNVRYCVLTDWLNPVLDVGGSLIHRTAVSSPPR